jgi:hypothetical protein
LIQLHEKNKSWIFRVNPLKERAIRRMVSALTRKARRTLVFWSRLSEEDKLKPLIIPHEPAAMFTYVSYFNVAMDCVCATFL